MLGVVPFLVDHPRSRRTMSPPRLQLATLCLSLALLALLVPSFAANRTEVIPGPAVTVWTPTGPQMAPPEAVSSRVIIRVREGTTDDDIQQALDRNGATLIKSIPSIRTHVIGLEEGLSVPAGIAQWQGEAIVEVVGEDRLCHYTAIPNDPEYVNQYHHPIINAPAGWDITTGSGNVVAAVVDSGVDLDHEDLQGRIWQNLNDPVNGIDDDGNGYIDDWQGYDTGNGDNDPEPHPADIFVYGARHGTHVAGIIGAMTNNTLGVAGVDWSCQLMAVKVGTDDGQLTLSAILEGFVYAVDNGADVINLSLHTGWTTLWDEPIANAVAQGTVVVVAAGNAYWEFTDDPNTWDSPVCNDGPFFTDNYVLGVAATDDRDVKADFSNYSSAMRNFVDVAAPGVDILSTYLYDPPVGFTEPYGLMSGTSMACPVVVGVAAMVKARFPGANASDVIQQIRLSADNIDAQNPLYVGKLGAGRVNLGNALIDSPPAAPKSVNAFDTPDDEGGSVTVLWARSADDGRGFNDVTGYDVLRSTTGDAGSFAPVRSMLAPGTTTYTDTAVTDGDSYWYQIRVHDAANTTESSIAGPAIPRDDLAPDAIVDLYVDDTIGDQGGSVTLNWSGYARPDDFARYRIYRSETSFNSLNDDDVVRLTSVTAFSPQVYVDQTSVDGTQYWYAVGVVDDNDNEDSAVTVIGPVVSSPNYTFSFPQGLSMIAIGAVTPQTDLATLLGVPPADLRIARYDPVTGNYVTYASNPGNPFLKHDLGRAFWLSTPSAILRSIAGQPAPAGDYSVDLVPGWLMIGNPYTTQMDMTAATVTVAGNTLSLAAAAQAGWVRDYMWAYDAFLTSYVLVSPSIGWATNKVDKGRGVFLRSFASGTLNLPRPGGAAEPTANENAIAADWKIRLTAECSGSADLDNFIGVSASAAALNGLAGPPPQGIDLYFGNDDNVRGAASFAEPGATDLSSPVKVRTEQAGAVTVRWPDLSSLPAEFRPYLVDKTTGKKVYMRTATAYTYDAQANEARDFDLELKADAGGALIVQSMAATPAGAGAQVTLQVNKDAQLRVEILNIAGRGVRTLAAVDAVAGAATTLSWNGRTAQGVVAPAGRYLVRVTATADDGQSASSVASVSVGR